MDSIPIIVSDDIDIEELVELAIDMLDVVLVGDIDIDIDVELVELVIDISMAGWVCKDIGSCELWCECFLSSHDS